MDANRKPYYRTVFENRFLRAKRTAFQDLFADLMERAHPGDFQRIEAAGPKGDRGCDGYLRSTRTVFQVYAPHAIRGLKELHDKITGDFEKAKAYFGDQMAGWIFVHNSREGLSADSVKFIQELEKQNPVITTGWWGYEELWGQVETLPQEKLDELLPPGPPELILSPESISSVVGATPPSAEALCTEAAAGTELPAARGSPAQYRILCEQVDAQAEAIQQHLDREGQRLRDEIKQQTAELSFAKAIAAGKEYEKWLQAEGSKASSVERGRACVLLADLAIIEASDTATLEGTDTTQARAYYELARDSFGVDISEEDSARLITLAAKLDAVEGKTAQALEQTQEADSPGVIWLRLAILIEQQSWPEAAALLRDTPLHEHWADSAVVVHLECGEHDRAVEVIDWAKSKDITLYHRCLLSFAGTIAVRAQEELQQQGPIVPGQLTASDRERLAHALYTLQPILCGPETSNQLRSGIEVAALAAAVSIAYFLGKFEECRRFCRLLAHHRPVHLTFAQMVLADVVESPEDLPERLRHDHPSSPEALTIAASIEGIRLGKPAESAAAVQRLIERAECVEMKERWCELLGELAAPLGPDAHSKIDSFLPEHLGEDHRLVRLRRAARLLVEENTVEAGELLESLRDEQDPVWWQLAAKLRYMQDNKSGAAEAQFAAARVLSRVEVWRSTAGLAQEAQRWDLLEDALKGVLALAPDDDRARFRLGMLYVDKQRFADAATCFKRLWDRHPDEVAFGLNLARCLRNDGRAQEGLAVLERICAKRPPHSHAVLSRAQILRELRKPDGAFQSLQPFRDDFWNDEDFLLAYVGFAYAAGRDDAAHEAFAQLLDLKREGKVSPDKLWSASIGQVVGFMKQRREALQAANVAVLRGQVPWLAVEQARRFPPYLGWRYRTQALNVSDSPDARATLAIYATNRFTVQARSEGTPWLEEIGCPPPGSDVVIDLTALISLHRLGLLNQALDYFGTLHVPALYIPTMADDTTNLAPHQMSAIQALESIDKELGTGHIRILPRGTAIDDCRLAKVVECYGKNQEPPGYHLSDLVGWLHSSGKLSETRYAQTQRIRLRPPRSDLPSFGAKSGNGILTDRDTLLTVIDLGLLDVVLRATTVHISENEADQVRSELRFATARDEVLGWHEDLSAIVADQSRFRRAASSRLPADGEPDEEPRRDRPLLAMGVALEQRLPLFVDDRACQAVVLNTRRDDASAAFGTDAFLGALLRRGSISVTEAARHYSSLMAWRYRFLVPPPAVLEHFAREYRSHVPGAPLVAIAQYMHDCMRAPGLFAGAEPTKPPVPLAVRLWLAWIRVSAEFLMGLWLDPDVGAKLAQELTRWTVTECLPVPPSNLHAMVQQNAAEMAPRSLLGAMLAAAISAKDEEAANHAILAVKDSLELSDLEYLRLIGDLTDVRLETRY